MLHDIMTAVLLTVFLEVLKILLKKFKKTLGALSPYHYVNKEVV